MSKIAEAYARSKHPKAKKIDAGGFSYADQGSSCSYVEISYRMNGKRYDEQLDMEEFFEWIGGQLLKIKQ